MSKASSSKVPPRHSYSEEFRVKVRLAHMARSTAPKATKKVTTRDLEWAAGFLEGEGHFRGANKGEGTTRIAVSQVNKEPIDRLVALFGGRATFIVRKAPNQPVWDWRVSGARARGISMTLYPLMSTLRKQQIKGALSKKI